MKESIPITLAEAREGDALAEDVKDARGNPLLKAGMALNERLLGLLRSKGIETLVVERDKVLSAQAEAAERRRIELKLEVQFRGIEMSPTMQTLKAILLKYHLRGL